MNINNNYSKEKAEWGENQIYIVSGNCVQFGKLFLLITF